MALVNPYIHFNGNAEQAFTFYKSIFGGEFTKIMRYKEVSSDEFPIPDSEANKIMQIILPVSKSSRLIASDTLQMMGKVNEADNRNAIYITAASREEADKLHNGLSEGGSVEMPISDGPTGSYFGMLTDKFGVEWMVEFTPDGK